MANILSPSILAADFGHLGDDIKQAEQAGAQYLHIDVMDGVFVPSISFGFPLMQSIRPLTNMIFDVHLMIIEPKRYIEATAQAGADIITIHYEACEDVAETLAQIKKCGCKSGLTIKPETAIEEVYPYLGMVDMVLIMTVEPGFGGQEFMPKMVEKVAKLRSYLTEHALNVDIEVDGGINEETLSCVLDAGANVIVAGSSIFRGDIDRNVKMMINRMQECCK